MLHGRYVVVDNFVPRELAARMCVEAHALQRQGKQSPPGSPGVFRLEYEVQRMRCSGRVSTPFC